MGNISNVDGMDQQQTNELLSALGEQLAARDARVELVVIGGSALLATGLISRPTRDVDIVGLLSPEGLVDLGRCPSRWSLPAARVARDFALPADRLNAQAASMLGLGLPEGFVQRLQRRDYGPTLTVHFASRIDQIHFKLYAMADEMAAKHEADLRGLEPTNEELLQAARWTRTQDPSEGFRQQLVAALASLGLDDADRDL